MTKQEQIEEMSGNIKEAFNSHCRLISANSCNDCEFLKYRKPGTDCQAMCIAEALYNAGYRKIDEVREETAKEIFKAIKEIIDNAEHIIDNYYSSWCPNIGYDKEQVDKGIYELAKQYGVDVEE